MQRVGVQLQHRKSLQNTEKEHTLVLPSTDSLSLISPQLCGCIRCSIGYTNGAGRLKNECREKTNKLTMMVSAGPAKANESRACVLKGSVASYLLFQMADQMQQLLHAGLQARRLATRKDSHRQGVSVQPGQVGNDPGVPPAWLDSLSAAVHLCVRLSPAIQQTLRSSTALWRQIG